MSGHVYSDYNGKYCRTEEDWNERAHYESYTHVHFYYSFLESNGYSCWNFDMTKYESVILALNPASGG